MRRIAVTAGALGVLLFVFLGIGPSTQLLASGLSITSTSASATSVHQYDKFELTVQISGQCSPQVDGTCNWQLPYDPIGATNVPARQGLSLDGVFTPPAGSACSTLTQPGFYYQDYTETTRTGEDGSSVAQEWLYRNSANDSWKVRVAFPCTGTWTYQVRAQDASVCGVGVNPCLSYVFGTSGTVSVTPHLPTNHGFLGVSGADRRYLRFSDSMSFFSDGVDTDGGNNGVNCTPGQLTGCSGGGYPDEWTYVTFNAWLQTWGNNHVHLVRPWMSKGPIAGSAWSPWHGWLAGSTTNSFYNGIIPGVNIFSASGSGHDLAYTLDADSSTGGSNATNCIQNGEIQGQIALQQSTTYTLSIRVQSSSLVVLGGHTIGTDAGLAVRWGDYPNSGQTCDGTLQTTPVTFTSFPTVVGSTSGYQTFTGTYTTGSGQFWAPKQLLWIYLTNLQTGRYQISDMSLTDPSGNNVLVKSDGDPGQSFNQMRSWDWDHMLDAAASNGVYLDIVVGDDNDQAFNRILPNGSIGAIAANQANYYAVTDTGTGGDSKNLVLQRYYWRYLGARWGYSTAVANWEYENEGQRNAADYTISSKFATYMHTASPSRHLATTSLDQFYPSCGGPNNATTCSSTLLWGNTGTYPGPDVGMLHHYTQNTLNEFGWYSDSISDGASGTNGAGTPIVLGESGLQPTAGTCSGGGSDCEDSRVLANDPKGVWLHNYLWSSLNRGGMYQLYWYQTSIKGNNLYFQYKSFGDFVWNLPIADGHWCDASYGNSGDSGATLSAGGLVAYGMRSNTGCNTTNDDQAAIWVQQSTHNLSSVVSGTVSWPAITGTLTVPNFVASRSYRVELWAYDTNGVLTMSAQTIAADGSGNVIVNVGASLSSSITDVGIKIFASPASPNYLNWQTGSVGLKQSNGVRATETAGLGLWVSNSSGWPFFSVSGGVAPMTGGAGNQRGAQLGAIASSGAGAALSMESSDWAHDVLTYTTGTFPATTGGPGLSLTVSRLTPALLLQTALTDVQLFTGNISGSYLWSSGGGGTLTLRTAGPGFPKYAAWPGTSGTVTVTTLSTTSTSLTTLSEPWMLVWYGNNAVLSDTLVPQNAFASSAIGGGGNGCCGSALSQAYLADTPILLTFDVLPTAMAQGNGSTGGIDLTFPTGGPVAMSILPLYGRLHPNATTTEGWQSGGATTASGATVVANIRALQPRLCAYPTTATETYSYLGGGADAATIEEQETFTQVCGAGITTTQSATIPPIVGVGDADLPVAFSAPVVDLGIATDFGPWQVVSAPTLQWTVSQLDQYVQQPPVLGTGAVPSDIATLLHNQLTSLLALNCSGNPCHLLPWNFSTTSPKLYQTGRQFLNDSGPELAYLSRIVPLLSGGDPLRATLISYLRSERTNCPPESTIVQPATTSGSGCAVTSNSVARAAESLANTTFVPTFDDFMTANRSKPTATSLWDYYGLERFYTVVGAATPGDLTATVEQAGMTQLGTTMQERAWDTDYPFENQTKANTGSATYGQNYLVDGPQWSASDQANQDVAGLIGLARMAKETNATADGNLVRVLLAKAAMMRLGFLHLPRWQYTAGLQLAPNGALGANWLINEYAFDGGGVLQRQSWTSSSDDPRQTATMSQFDSLVFSMQANLIHRQAFGLVGYTDLTRETAMMLQYFAGTEADITAAAVRENYADWYIAWHRAMLGTEFDSAFPTDAHGLFMEAAYVQQASGGTLASYLDVPWLAGGGDYYWYDKLATTWETYAGPAAPSSSGCGSFMLLGVGC